MSWKDYERRQRLMDGVLDEVAASGDWSLPRQRQPEISETFGDDAGFALALYPRWFSALSARLDVVLEELPADLAGAAEREATRLARERPAMIAVLAAYADDPALSAARRREEQYLDWAPGAHLPALAARLDDLLPVLA